MAGGLTPLMVASCVGPSLEEENPQAAATVETLVAMGADVNAQSDISGDQIMA